MRQRNAAVPYPFAEYEDPYLIMPIRMVLVMNQTKIPNLLIECCNSSMPIEVREIRIRPGKGGALEVPAGGKGVAGGDGHAAFGIGGQGAAGQVAYKKSRGQTFGGPLDVPIEIKGVIYIYNPPDRDKLGTEAQKSAEVAAAPGDTETTGPAGEGQPPTAGGS